VLGLLVNIEGLHVWDEVALFRSLLVLSNLGGLLSLHHQCKGKYENYSLHVQF
jgi:hypothetical protein